MKLKDKYLKEIVFGSIDGIITTFAIVTGVIGASLSYGVIIILGLANLLADGFSMASGDYLSTKSELERIKKKSDEYRLKVNKDPKDEILGLENMFREKGFSEDTILKLVKDVTSNKKAWENLMISEEYGEYEKMDPKKTAMATFIAFVVAGLIPLSAFIFAYIFESFRDYASMISIILTGFALFMVGNFKAHITKKDPIKSGLETLFIGGIAALGAFMVGFLLKEFVS